MSQTLDEEFDAAMEQIHSDAKARVKNYRGTRFYQMLREYGGVATAKRLLADATIHDGFTDLALAGCSELTAESLVMETRFQSLFTPQEIAEAKRRLGR